MGKKALLIAIKETRNRPDLGLSSLPFAHRDARAMCKCLIRDHSYQQDDIVVMLDSPEIPEHLQPTGPNIIREIRNLVSKLAKGDHHVFYYSGHGVQTICEDNTEWDGRNEGIVAMDGEYIVDDLLHNKLVVPLKKTKKTTLFALFDCCHSETMLDLRRGRFSRTWSGGPGRTFVGVCKSFVQLLKCSGAANKGKQQPMIDPLARNQASCTVLSAGDKKRRRNKKRKRNGLIAISLSASRDSQLAFDDAKYGITTTKFFLDVISMRPHEHDDHPRRFTHPVARKDLTWEELRDRMTERIGSMGERRALLLPQGSLHSDPDMRAQQPRYDTFLDMNLKDKVVL